MLKRCYKCTHTYPLFLFHKDRRKFQLKFNKGTCAECRFCTADRVYSGSIIRYNFNTNKFDTIEVNPNWINWIKVFIGWKMN
jgi:hypothetical protein